MAVYEIELEPNLKNDTFNCTLDKLEYIFYLKYNTKYDYYTWSLYKKDNTPLIQGQKLISNYCLNYRFTNLDLPKGRLIGINISNDGKEANQTNLGKVFKLVYEVEDI